MAKHIKLEQGDLSAEINTANGQLVSFMSSGSEYMHDGGFSSYTGPGWGNSEVVAFPIFGPADNQEVKIGKNKYSLEQHGISRHTAENPFKPAKQKKKSAISLVQKYKGRKISNPKYKPGNGRPMTLNWLPYTLEKVFELSKEGLSCKLILTNDSDSEMPYMIGWHPAFKVFGSMDEGEFINEDGVCLATLEEVIKQSAIPPEEALTINGLNSISYRNKNTGKGVKVSSKDFSDSIMLWSPARDAGMLCIEHTSQLPVYDEQNYFGEPKDFELLAPGEKRIYSIEVIPLAG